MSSEDGAGAGSGKQVVCFGVLSYLQLMAVDRIPIHNTGLPIQRLTDSYGDDAAIVAGMLHQWGQKTRLIPSALGDDDLGAKVAAIIVRQGIPAEITLDPQVATVAELSIVDPSGGRTYFYQRTPELVATLDDADLTPLEGAGFLYVDWYDGNHIFRAIKAASGLGVPVLVNIESQYRDHELLSKLAPYAPVCQVSADDANSEEDMVSIAEGLLDSGMATAVVTGGGRGSLAADAGQTVRVSAPRVDAIDGNGAGSCFSAGFIYGSVRGWSLEQCARFATAQASLKCGMAGYKVASIAEGERLAAELVSEVRTRL
ncbi:MAG: PfkB family carbohydrate kinase [Chloroflexi bacterium]|nr:PfkB family carbohydrate kinase [Chloroflexota bacterium]MDA1270489.1 PfkB family carbohydrate kinase [Chloroflexota bacterium]